MLNSIADTAPVSAFFEQLYDSFTKIQKITGVTTASYAIAGQSFQLSFAGDALIPFVTPALEHLRKPNANAAGLQVYLWDTMSTGVRLPDFDWKLLEALSRYDLSHKTRGNLRVAFNLSVGQLSLYDVERNVALYCVYDASKTPPYAGLPLLQIFHWWLHRQGLQLVHAGAIGLPGKGVLLTGYGGAGKSTTALSSLASDLFYASDDYCVISATDAPRAYSLYNSGKVEEDNLRRLPHLSAVTGNTDRLHEGKALAFLHQQYPEKLILEFPVVAILMPRVTGLTETRIVPVSRLEALQPLMVSTMKQLTGDDTDFKVISSLIRQTPCFCLEVGTDLPGAMAAIKDFLLSC